jgi:hypothetical protein
VRENQEEVNETCSHQLVVTIDFAIGEKMLDRGDDETT